MTGDDVGDVPRQRLEPRLRRVLRAELGNAVGRHGAAGAAHVVGIYGKLLVVTIGTNHSYYTVNHTVSDHASGHASDIGMAANAATNDGLVGDQIMTARLIAAGTDPTRAGRAAR